MVDRAQSVIGRMAQELFDYGVNFAKEIGKR